MIKPNKLRRRIAQSLHNRYVKAQSELHELNYFFWECTSNCNLSCLHCGSDCKIIPDVKDMPAADFLNVAKQVATQYNPREVMIVITGGEPLMRKDLPETGRELAKMGFPWGMVSNGYMLTPDLFRKLRDGGLRSATISLDGLEESHDWMRGKKGSFERAVSAISMLAKEPGMIYDVVTCVNQRNIGELNQIKDLLISIGVKRWRLFMIDPIGRAAENPELLLNPEQFKQILDFIVENRNTGKISTSYGCDGYLNEYETKVREGFLFCRAGIHVASVLSNGDIGACPNINRGFVQGNIYKDDFLDIWNNKFEIYRNRKHFKTGSCKSCKEWKNCRGDGMHLHEPGNENVLVCYNRLLCKAK
jgi:radical SAM enzyme (rSAM/lipoprotein system)